MGGAHIMVLAGSVLAGACVPTVDPAAQGDFAPVYQGVQTLLLDGDLVDFRVGCPKREQP